jgi:hypothetical protein
MNVWLKAALYLIFGIVLDKVINNIFYEFLNTKGEGVNLVGAVVPSLFGTTALVYFGYKAFAAVKSQDKILSVEKEDLSVYAEAISEINSNNKNE